MKTRFRKRAVRGWLAIAAAIFPMAGISIADQLVPPPSAGTVRVATFNVALNRKSSGELSSNLESGDKQVSKIAAILQEVSPDIVLLNEVDFDGGRSAKLLVEKYLHVPQAKVEKPLKKWGHLYAAEVNTGVPSSLDLNQNGKTGEPDDSWGYGAFPGQYGMLVLSRFPIAVENVRTFQKFLWRDMPNALVPGTGPRGSAEFKPFYPEETWKQLRLSSKSHWDVPIQLEGKTLHLLVSHPTPPVFDGPEDRNGCRNDNEIRFWKDYVEGGQYMVDDRGTRGGLDRNKSFVILGDLNADPVDGNGNISAIQELLASSRIQSEFIPSSEGAIEAASKQGNANAKQKGDPKYDTGDFNDRNPGNLRVDFVLPSKDLPIVQGGVFWPSSSELEKTGFPLEGASDHHLVWLDVKVSE